MTLEWKDISTAPKDRRILIYRPGMDRMSFGRYEPDGFARKPKPYWDCESATIHGKTWARQHPPSHWAEITKPEVSK